MEIQNRNEYYKKYYSENKERIKEYQTNQILCETCNKSVTKWNLTKHNNTKKHLCKIILQRDIF
jgi:deoxyadenosine/deoxycytidine kinase